MNPPIHNIPITFEKLDQNVSKSVLIDLEKEIHVVQAPACTACII